MAHSNKRLLALILALMMCISLLPATALAEGEDEDAGTITLAEEDSVKESSQGEEDSIVAPAPEAGPEQLTDPEGCEEEDPGIHDGSDLEERAPTPATTNVSGNELVAYARSFLGKPYIIGGRSPAGFDCCGLVWYVCNHFGIDIGTGNQSSQINYGAVIPYDKSSYSSVIQNMQVGDLVYFDYGSNGSVDHVAIYTGNGSIINAENSGVLEHTLNQSGWPDGLMWTSICGVRRVLDTGPYYLDLNGYLDGGYYGDIGGYGTADVYINGDLVAEGVEDYYTSWPYGTKYEIRNIRPNGNISFDGAESGPVSGTLTGDTDVRLTFHTVPDQTPEPVATQTYDGHEYMLFTTPVTWYEAETYCERLGGHLVTITSADENAFVLDLVGESDCWLGLRRDGYGAFSEWVNGESLTYTNWHSGEPSNDTRNDELSESFACLTDFNSVFAGEWNDVFGYYKSPFVCEVDTSYHSFDLNGILDGEFFYDLGDFGTVDVYINGYKIADDVSDYYADYPSGTWVYIDDIWANRGYEYNGVYYGSTSFVIEDQDVECVLSFSRGEPYIDLWPQTHYMVLGQDITATSYLSWGGALPDDWYFSASWSNGDVIDFSWGDNAFTVTAKKAGYSWVKISLCRSDNNEELCSNYVSVYVTNGMCGDNLYWWLDENATLFIDGSGDMYDFSAAGAPWYNLRDSIFGAWISSGATSIGKNAFYGCKNLRYLTISDTVTSIGEQAFSNCTSLESVSIPEGVSEISDWLFSFCTSLTTVTLPDSITRIGKYAFVGCDNLSDINIPGNVTVIDDVAFGDCTSLQNISLPEGLIRIGQDAFDGSGLYQIWIPSTVEIIDSYAFWNCSGLEGIYVSSYNSYFSDYWGVLCDKTQSTIIQFPGGRNGSFSVPDTVRTIGMDSFNRAKVESVTIPASVTSIGAYAFCNCGRLSEIIFEGSAPAFGTKVFNYDTATAYYPANDESWTEGVRQNYGGTITWVAYSEQLVNPFTDVKEGKYYYEPVLWAYYHDPQITGGVSDTEFGPGKTCTREQIVTFLWKAMGAPEPKMTVNPFEDVKSTKYYYKAVLWAVENGITGGADATHFGVGKPCTREQAMTFLWKACGSPEPVTTDNPFQDVKSTKYYYKAVLWAVENGVTGGVDATHFGVGNPCTRGQIVTFLYKALG